MHFKRLHVFFQLDLKLFDLLFHLKESSTVPDMLANRLNFIYADSNAYTCSITCKKYNFVPIALPLRKHPGGSLSRDPSKKVF